MHIRLALEWISNWIFKKYNSPIDTTESIKYLKSMKTLRELKKGLSVIRHYEEIMIKCGSPQDMTSQHVNMCHIWTNRYNLWKKRD